MNTAAARRVLPRLTRNYTPVVSSSRQLSTATRSRLTASRHATPLLSTSTRQTALASRGTFKRAYSSEGGAPPTASGGIWSPLTTVLLVAGVGAIGYGLYEMYGTLTMWPQEIRSDLREALEAKEKGDLTGSVAYLQRAWQTTKTLPLTHFHSQPHLKTSGVAILLGELLELSDNKLAAYDVYADALKQLQDSNLGEVTGPEKMRAVALAYKLGELCEVLQKPKEEEEKWLTFGVETVLKHVLEVPSPSSPGAGVGTGAGLGSVAVPEGASTGTPAEEEESMLVVGELGLPDWVVTVDVAATFEALGTFYSKAGKLDYAMPLLLQAVSILIPPAPRESTPEDRCRGAQLMTSISEMIIRNNLSRETVQQAESWAMKGLEVVVSTRKGSKEPIPMCEIAYAVQLFNMASLRAIGGDINKAKDLFARSANQAKLIGYQSLVDTSNQAIQELDSRTQQQAPKTT